MKDKLWCDLHSTKKKIEFLRSGRAVDTGIMSKSIVQDILTAYERITELKKRIIQLEDALEDIATYATIETPAEVMKIINGMLNKEDNT